MTLKSTRIGALLLVLAMLLCMLAGCGSSSSSSTSTSSSTATTSSSSDDTTSAVTEESTEAAAASESTTNTAASGTEAESVAEESDVNAGLVAGDIGFDWSVYLPLTEELTTLTMFYTQPPALATVMDTPNDLSYLYQTFEEITNVHIDFTMVNMADATTRFTLMIASGDYCDITNDALSYYNSADQAYEDGICVDLLEYLDCVPNFMAILEEYPDAYTDLLTLEGHILNMPRIDLPIADEADNGLLIRQDWLDALGMDIPQTYEEMHDVMLAFKTVYGCTDPYVMPYQVLSPWGLMAGGYGISVVADSNNFYVDLTTQTVQHSCTSDAYYEYLSMFRSWYEEGLINPDFTSSTSSLPDQTLITNEQTGIWFSDVSYIKTYVELMADVNADCELALMKDPGIDSERSGYIASSSSIAGSGGFCVSESCSNIELALQWCDMWYDTSLTQFINYGYEGETFEYDEDGNPVLGGIITNNDLNLPSLKMCNGVFLCTSGGFLYDKHKYDLEYIDLQIESYDGWQVSADDPSTVTTSGVPRGAKMSADEADRVTAIMSDINTYVAEMALKFVTGVVELNEANYADYVANIKAMDLDSALSIEQAAYDRYLANSQ